MCGMFGWMYVYAQPAQAAVVEGIFVPWCQNCSSGAVEQGLGIVGAVIMPHNLYLHSGLVLSRAISRQNKVDIKEGIKYNTIESTIALFISFIINLFVVCVFGASVFGYNYASDIHGKCAQHISDLATVQRECTEQISLLNAADCLYYRFHCQEWVRYIWAIGLLAAGQSSTMTGTYAGQFVMEGFLNLHWARWKRVLLTRSVAMVPCVIIAIVAVNSLDYLDEYINVEQSMLLPFSLIPLLHATSSKTVMGDFKNSIPGAIVVWIIAIVVVVVNVYFIISTVAISRKVVAAHVCKPRSFNLSLYSLALCILSSAGPAVEEI
ncbi:Natural resistance-associated macrophage protein 2 [Geodia barretti]|uniref:Natural resistance-associated macrophage protein 2 n=1 Tax=Geodia barretti TaxID=519541 RepID=A0AA35WYJ7_GEOBA|nr:Natural resistance-associated macrophage protein 2 [Geodia barretti]